MDFIKEEKLGLEKLNNQGCLMKIIEYNSARDIVVEFQDEYKKHLHVRWSHFLDGSIRNPYFPSVYGVGILGEKYQSRVNKKKTKEYFAWKGILERCYDKKYKEKYPTYENVTCCKEWLLYENFYEWLHGQENFEKWINGKRWGIDKDIIFKHNKVYSPDTCCLVPDNINKLFTKADALRGNYPIGVHWHKANNCFCAQVCNPITNEKEIYLHYYNINDTFCKYKERKEEIIKQVAEIEYNKGNIIKKCYDAMTNYQVEITD